MCQYFGGKIRLGNEISRCIKKKELEVLGHNDAIYFEPFLGMAGVFRHMAKGCNREAIGCDSHYDLMLMWEAVSKGWIPPSEVSRSTHEEMKTRSPSALRGFIGFGCSYMGKFYSGFTETSFKSYNQIVSVSELFRSRHVIFLDHADYKSHDPHHMTIYCDPPYQESRSSNDESKCFRGFDHSGFWETMRKWSIDNLVFISETSAPSDFCCIWEKNVGRIFLKNKVDGRRERLFCHESFCQ